VKRGELEDLKKSSSTLKNQGRYKEALDNLILLHAFDGSGKMDKLDNQKFSHIKPFTLEDYLRVNFDKFPLKL